MLIKTKILLNVFQEEIDSITFEESEIDRLIKGMDSDEYYNTSESKIISKEFKECIISLDTGTILVKKGDKKIIYLELDDGMSFEEEDLDLFAHRFYNGEIIE